MDQQGIGRILGLTGLESCRDWLCEEFGLQSAFDVLSSPSQGSKSLPGTHTSQGKARQVNRLDFGGHKITSGKSRYGARPREALRLFFPILPGQQQVPGSVAEISLGSRGLIWLTGFPWIRRPEGLFVPR